MQYIKQIITETYTFDYKQSDWNKIEKLVMEWYKQWKLALLLINSAHI